MHLIGASLGLFAGLVTWFTASHWLASSILWAEDRYPGLIGSKRLRVYEIIICGLLVVACFALAVWVMLLIAE